jgi:hypothetical protein
MMCGGTLGSRSDWERVERLSLPFLALVLSISVSCCREGLASQVSPRPILRYLSPWRKGRSHVLLDPTQPNGQLAEQPPLRNSARLWWTLTLPEEPRPWWPRRRCHQYQRGQLILRKQQCDKDWQGRRTPALPRMISSFRARKRRVVAPSRASVRALPDIRLRGQLVGFQTSARRLHLHQHSISSNHRRRRKEPVLFKQLHYQLQPHNHLCHRTKTHCNKCQRPLQKPLQLQQSPNQLHHPQDFAHDHHLPLESGALSSYTNP